MIMPKNSPEMVHSKLLMLPENLQDALELSMISQCFFPVRL